MINELTITVSVSMIVFVSAFSIFTNAELSPSFTSPQHLLSHKEMA